MDTCTHGHIPAHRHTLDICNLISKINIELSPFSWNFPWIILFQGYIACVKCMRERERIWIIKMAREKCWLIYKEMFIRPSMSSGRELPGEKRMVCYSQTPGRRGTKPCPPRLHPEKLSFRKREIKSSQIEKNHQCQVISIINAEMNPTLDTNGWEQPSWKHINVVQNFPGQQHERILSD